MRGLKQDRSAKVVLAEHALVQNLRRRHYELTVEEPASLRVAAAFDSSPWRSDPSAGNGFGMPPVDQMQQSPCGDDRRWWRGDRADLAVLRDKADLFGAVASDRTAWRLLSEVDGGVLAGLRAAGAHRGEACRPCS